MALNLSQLLKEVDKPKIVGNSPYLKGKEPVKKDNVVTRNIQNVVPVTKQKVKEKTKREEEYKKNNPIKYNMLKTAVNVGDKVFNNPIVNNVSAWGNSLYENAPLGLLSQLTKISAPNIYKAQQRNMKENPTATMSGKMYGYIAPGTAFSKVASKLPLISKIGSKTLRAGVQEGLAGLGMGATEGLIKGENNDEIKNRALTYGVGGALFGGGLTKAGELITRQFKPSQVGEKLVTSFNNANRILDEPITQNIDELANSVRNKISREPNKTKTNFKELYGKLKTQFVDSNAALQDLEKGIRGKINSAETSLYKQARLFKGIPERANEIIRTELEPIIKQVEKSGYSYKDLGDYAEMVHAKDINNAGMKSGFSNEQINAVIQKYGTPEMESARKSLVEYSNNRLKTLVDSGRISQEEFNSISSKWENYMPLSRKFDDDKVEFVGALKEKFSNPANPIQKLKGSEREVIDPIESLIKNTYKIENSAGQTKVGKQLINLANEDVDNNFIRKLNPGEEIGRKNVVSVYDEGKNIQYEVPPTVYKAMEGLNKESSNILLKMLAKPASVLRAGATLTPEFAARNPMRDVLNAYIVKGFNPVTDFSRGLFSAIKKDKYYTDFLKNNGGYGNIMSMDRKVHNKMVQDIVKQPVYKKMVNIINPNSWLKVLRSVSDATETATKLGTYRKLVREGVSKEEAAYQSRDLMDFARSGATVKEWNKVTAFLNANIQGKSKVIRALKEDPMGVMARTAKAIALPTIGIYVLNEKFANENQKAQIKDAPNWLKDNFWLIAIPGTDTVARIPKPFDFSIVANTLERSMDYLYKQDKEAFGGFLNNTLKQQAIPVMLSGITPILEAIGNYSTFRDYAPLIPEREKNLQAKDQYDVNTSEISKILAGGVRKFTGESAKGGVSNFGSPRVMDNTIYGLTAGVGRYGTDLFDYIAGKTGLTEEKTKPAKNLSQKPVVRAFAVNENATGKSLELLYNERDRLTKEKTSFESNLPSESKEQYPQEINLGYLTKTTDAIGKVSKAIREVTNSKGLNSEQKRQAINKLSQVRNDLSRKFAEGYKKINKEDTP